MCTRLETKEISARTVAASCTPYLLFTSPTTEPWVEIQPLISSLVAELYNNYGYLSQVTGSRKHCVVMKQSIGAYASVVIAGLTVTDKTLRACGNTITLCKYRNAYWTGDCEGPRSRLDVVEKRQTLFLSSMDPRYPIVHFVASSHQSFSNSGRLQFWSCIMNRMFDTPG